VKYIKKFEVLHNYLDESTDIEEDDYVVAYRPYKDYSDVVKPITIEYDNYVIEVGIVSKVILKRKTWLYSVIFPGGRYMRFKKHILYHSKDKEDAIQYAEMLKIANKYNLG